MHVRVVGEQFTWTFYYRGPDGGKEVASPQLYVPRGPPGQLHRPVQGRDPRLLGAGLPHEDRRGAGHRHASPRHAERARQLPRRLRRAVRARALDDAPDRARGRAGRLRRAGCRSAQRPAGGGAQGGGGGGGGGAAPTARRSSPRQRLRRLPHARRRGHDRHDGPDLDEVLKGKDEAFIRRSIADPDAEIAKGFQDGIMPPNFGTR